MNFLRRIKISEFLQYNEIIQFLAILGLCRLHGMMVFWNHGILAKNA